MDLKLLGEVIAVLVGTIAFAVGVYKVYKHLSRDQVSVSLLLKSAHKTQPKEGEKQDRAPYPILAFGVSITNDSKREISIMRCYLHLDKKLKGNRLFKGLYKQYFKFDDEDLRFEYKSIQGKNLPLSLPRQFSFEVQLGHYHLIEYLLSTDIRLVLIDQRRKKYTSNLVRIDP